MKIHEIKAALRPLGCLLGINLYPGEPTPSFHIVAVQKGTRAAAKAALEAAGAKVTIPIGSNIYAEYLNVYRKDAQ